jgi:A/G-specific adenine glycosylase
MIMTDLPPIHRKLVPWHRKFGRHDLPWQTNKSPYTVWLSEVMLQQTQVATVIPYFHNFLQHFPDIYALASASIDEVLSCWSGLGYYSRGRNLHKAAQRIVESYDGNIPDDIAALQDLPGIGPSTAAAILSLAYNKKHAILDGNVKRVLCRYHGLSVYPDKPEHKQLLWQLAHSNMSTRTAGEYTQAIMDLGATVCSKRQPDCDSCPLKIACQCRQQQAFDTMPLPKPKKKVPEKSIYFAVILNRDGDTLLQKRPEQGIWGGLWSFIEAETVSAFFELSYLEEQDWTELPTFSHTFTHFKLHITPILFELARKPRLNANQIWYNSDNHTVGLAKPVSKILEQVMEFTS